MKFIPRFFSTFDFKLLIYFHFTMLSNVVPIRIENGPSLKGYFGAIKKRAKK